MIAVQGLHHQKTVERSPRPKVKSQYRKRFCWQQNSDVAEVPTTSHSQYKTYIIEEGKILETDDIIKCAS